MPPVADRTCEGLKNVSNCVYVLMVNVPLLELRHGAYLLASRADTLADCTTPAISLLFLPPSKYEKNWRKVEVVDG